MQFQWRAPYSVFGASAINALSGVLAGIALTVIIAACDRARDAGEISSPIGPRLSAAPGRIDSARLSKFRETGEGCAVSWRDTARELHGFAMPRTQLPFQVPAIERNPQTGRGNGRVALLIMKPSGGDAPVYMSCWLPTTVRAQQVEGAVKAAAHDAGWTSLRASQSLAPRLAARSERGPLSTEALAFENEMLGDDSAAVDVRVGALEARPPANAFGGQNPPVRRTTLECEEYMSRGPRRPMVGSGEPSGPVALDYGDCSCYEWDATIWFDGNEWNFNIHFYFCDGNGGYGGSGGWGDDYGWMIDNNYWQWPCGGQTMSPVDTIRQEYFDGSLYDSTAFGSTDGPGSVPAANRAGVHWTPRCGDFTANTSTRYFGMPELKDPTASYLVLNGPLAADTSSHYGLDYWRAVYGSARTATSIYRTPRHNHDPSVGGALGSEHMRGVAADLRNDSQTQAEWNSMVAAAQTAQASYIEPTTLACHIDCTHADWRWWVAWPRN